MTLDNPLDPGYNTRMMNDWKELADLELLGDLYEEAMEILRQDYGADLLADSDLTEEEEKEIIREFYADPKD